jgi:hypothetical protein
VLTHPHPNGRARHRAPDGDRLPTFAGQVTETNGDLDEETDAVTWDDSGPMEVVADAGDGFGWLLGTLSRSRPSS